MSRPEQILKIEPQYELLFRGPFNIPATSYMKLTNPSEKRVVFKIKTTAPKKYCVRPNCGILEPERSIEIALCLQPFSYDPAEKNKHKFMVQSIAAPEGDINLDQVWRDVTQEELMDTKLKCVFEVPEDQPPSDQEEFSPQDVSTPNDSEKEKTTHELRHLREEGLNLKHENQRLKEEINQMRKHIGVTITSPSSTDSIIVAYTIPMVYLSAGIIMSIAGFFLGKYVF